MTYIEAKRRAQELADRSKELGAILQAFPRNPWGLVSDATRKTPEYQAAKRAFDAAFAEEREFNQFFVKTFRHERNEERAGRLPGGTA